MSALAKAAKGFRARLCLGVEGRSTDEMLELAQHGEALAVECDPRIVFISRPADDCRTQEDLERYYEALAAVAKRPVIIQTYNGDNCPAPSVELLVRLAERHPAIYGWIKEEVRDGFEANRRMKAELAAKPPLKTIFSAWGGWQWLFQSRQCGSEGLITERCAYAPLLAKIWRLMEANDQTGEVDLAYALLRLLIDQRNFPGGLRGYSLYYLQKAGCFANLVSREYEKSKQDDGGTRGEGKKWKLGKVSLSDDQKAELDALWNTMQAFCRR